MFGSLGLNISSQVVQAVTDIWPIPQPQQPQPQQPQPYQPQLQLDLQAYKPLQPANHAHNQPQAQGYTPSSSPIQIGPSLSSASLTPPVLASSLKLQPQPIEDTVSGCRHIIAPSSSCWYRSDLEVLIAHTYTSEGNHQDHEPHKAATGSEDCPLWWPHASHPFLWDLPQMEPLTVT